MKNDEFRLPIGFNHGGQVVKRIEKAETKASAEEIYTATPDVSDLYSWFGEVIAVSCQSIAGEPVSAPFIESLSKVKKLPSVIGKIPLVDVGSLLLQVQIFCWEDVISEQQIICRFCSKSLVGDIDLKKMLESMPFSEDTAPVTELTVPFGKEFTIRSDIEQLAEFNDVVYNGAIFRVPVLDDAIRHEKIGADEVLFWRDIAFDCLEALVFIDENGTVERVADGYISRRGKQLFTKDWDTKTLKKIRSHLQTKLPSAKFYYEDVCPCPKRRTIAYFTDVTNFFR